MKKLFAVLAAVLLLAIMACSSGGGGSSDTSDPNATVLASNAKQLDSSTTSNLSSVSADGVTLSFSATTPQLDGLKQDDVIISGVTTAAPRGLLKKVVSVTKLSDGTVQVTTTPAALTDAFQELHISGTITGASNESLVNKSIKIIKKASGASVSSNIPNISYKIPSTNFSVSGSYSSTLSGDYSFTPDFVYQIDIFGGHLYRCKLELIGTSTLSMDEVIKIQGGVSLSSPEIPLTALPIPIAIIPAGPVVISLEMTPYVGIKFSADGKLEINDGFTSSSTVACGFDYYNGNGWGGNGGRLLYL